MLRSRIDILIAGMFIKFLQKADQPNNKVNDNVNINIKKLDEIIFLCVSANMTGSDQSQNFSLSKSADSADRDQCQPYLTIIITISTSSLILLLIKEMCWLSPMSPLSHLSRQRNPSAFYFRMVTHILWESFALKASLSLALSIFHLYFWPTGCIWCIQYIGLFIDAQLKDRTRPFRPTATATHTGFLAFMNSPGFCILFICSHLCNCILQYI